MTVKNVTKSEFIRNLSADDARWVYVWCGDTDRYDIDYIAIPYAQTELDGHPTVAGHKYIAKKIVRAIQNG